MGHLSVPVVGMIVLLILVGLAVTKIGMKRTPRSGAHDLSALPVTVRSALLNSTEQQVYARLVQACPNHLIFCQVSLRQLLDLAPGAPRSAANHFQLLAADFVLCTKKFEPCWVIEVDGPMHRRERQRQRDARKDTVLRAAGLPLLRIPADAVPTVESLRKDLGLMPSAIATVA
jgi:Protein of unknown function (DUF2726)